MLPADWGAELRRTLPFSGFRLDSSPAVTDVELQQTGSVSVRSKVGGSQRLKRSNVARIDEASFLALSYG